MRAFLTQYIPEFLFSALAALAYLASKKDSLAQGSALQDMFLFSLQPTLSSLNRVILCLPQHIPPEVLMTPPEPWGWGRPTALVRGHLSFLHKFVRVFEGRSAVCGHVLDELCSSPTQAHGADGGVFY